MGYTNPEDKAEWQRKDRAKKRALGIKVKNYHPPGYKYYTKEEYNAWQRAYRKRLKESDPEGVAYREWVSQLRVRYGITAAEYFDIYARQEGVCAICRRPESSLHQSGKIRRLAVDHCHETGKVRGLLCGRCNKSLGGFQDDIGLLARAIDYLVEYSDHAD